MKNGTHLTVGTDLLDDLPDLGLETHVEHPVGLVHDEVGNTAGRGRPSVRVRGGYGEDRDSPEVELATLEHVDETSGGSDDNLGSTLEVTDLSSLGNSSVNASVPDPRGGSELGALLLDLDGELTGRSEDEDDGSVSGGEEGLGVDVDHGGEGEGDGLSGSSGRDGDEITSGEGHGPRLALNGGGGGEAGALDLGHNVVGEVGLSERVDGLGDVASEDLDLLFTAGESTRQNGDWGEEGEL
jgi:hypothetical protein